MTFKKIDFTNFKVRLLKNPKKQTFDVSDIWQSQCLHTLNHHWDSSSYFQFFI